MARAPLRFTVTDANGRAIKSAAVHVYQPGTTDAPAGAMYAAESGGSPTNNPLVTNSRGEVAAWLDTPQVVDFLVTDNSGAAQYAGSSTAVDFADLTIEDIVVRPGASTDIAGAATNPSSFNIENNSTDQHSLTVQNNNGDGEGTLQVFSIENSDPGPHDVNFRNSTIAFGSALSAEQVYGLYTVRWFAPSGETGNYISMYKPGETDSDNIVFAVNNAGTLTIACGGLATNALIIKVPGEANSRFRATEFGQMDWGAGGASALDVSLSRTAANTLTLAAGDSFRIVGANHASLPAATGFAAGAQHYCIDDKQPIWSDGTNWVEADGTNH